MSLPFTESQFLDVFAAFNLALWPAVVALWIITFVVTVQLLRTRRAGGGVMFLLAVHWLWSGVVYHWLYFRAINPAAQIFAALFVLQGGIFTWAAFDGKAHVDFTPSGRGLIGMSLLVYGLVYPFAGMAFGLRYPRLPLFAVPCPTTLITAGLLFLSHGQPRLLSVVPFLWAAVGSSAAWALGIRADLGLLVAAVLLGLNMIIPQSATPARAS